MSSGISISVDIKDGATPAVSAVLDALTDPRPLHESMGMRARKLTRDHLTSIAGSRHKSAQKLGASPSGHWAQAAEKTSFSADSLGATVTISQPGIGRAMHDVEIFPGAGKKFLTIPLIAAVYNVRALSVAGLFVAKSKKGGLVLAKQMGTNKDAPVQAWYLLLPHVHQAQDRSLLPSNEQYQIAAKQGAQDYFKYLLGLS